MLFKIQIHITNFVFHFMVDNEILLFYLTLLS
jgi:hypothetical protein